MIGALRQPCLELVVSRAAAGAGALEEKIAAAVAGGVDIVQLREPELPSGALYELATRLRGATAGRASFFVNDRVDVAIASGADGVHLPGRGLAPDVCRRLAPHLLIGAAVHSVDEGCARVRAGADFLVAGTLFASPSKPEVRPAGVGLVAALCSVVDRPVLGIGGIGPGQVGDVIGAGAAGVAVVTSILRADDPTRAARELRRALDSAFAARLSGEAAGARREA